MRKWLIRIIVSLVLMLFIGIGIFAQEIPTETLLAEMSREEKVGQLFVVGVAGSRLNPQLATVISEYYIGGVIFYRGNIKNPAQFANFTNDLQLIAEQTPHKIPLLVCLDQEGGIGQHLAKKQGGTDMPGNMAIGATRSLKDAYLHTKIMAEELKAVGVNCALAPVVDVNCNPANPIINVRSFGSRPELVARMGIESVKGFQENGVIATIKHFPGHGDTAVDSHKGLPIVSYSLERLQKVEFLPFRSAIEKGADALMTAHIVYPVLDPAQFPATLSQPVLSDLLRIKMGFNGIVFTDGMEMAAIRHNYGTEEATIAAINAGADIVLVCSNDTEVQKQRVRAVLKAVEDGAIPLARIDESARRILKVKKKYGLFQERFHDPDEALGRVGSEQHKETALGLARAAVTLVQNKNHLLPLNRPTTEKILVVCPGREAVDPCTNWSVELSKTLGAAIQQKYEQAEVIEITSSPSPKEIQKCIAAADNAETVIVGTLNAHFSPEQISLVETLLETDLPVIIVSLGMPYDLLDFPEVDAFIATYGGFRECLVDASVEVIFGQTLASGLLPVNIGELYPFDWSANFGMVKGKVVDKKGNPLSGARISLPEIGKSTISVAYKIPGVKPGDYSIGGLVTGKWLVEVSCPGYQLARQKISIQPSKIIQQNFTLQLEK